MEKKLKTAKQMERNLKGAANHWRISILLLLGRRSGLNLEEIVDALSMNNKTASEHTRRLMQAGLINKKYVGRNVEHTLSPYGKVLLKFLTTFQHS